MKPKLQLVIFLLGCNNLSIAFADAFQSYATVVNVQPVRETVYEPVTHRVCTDPVRDSREFTQISDSIGEDIRQQEKLWQAHRSCRTITETQTRERIRDYLVTYRYRGYTSTTRLSHDPGERMPVNVSLSPLP